MLVELGGFRPDEVTLLQSPTTEQLRAALAVHEQVAQDNDGDLFLFYYSGHADAQGIRLGDGEVGFEELRDDLRDMPAEVRLGILDSCRSGEITRLKGLALTAPFLDQDDLSAEGEAWLTASSADESAQESDRLHGSFFTHYLISGLRGAADKGDGVVSLDEAYAYAYDRTVARTGGTLGGTQHPAYDFRIQGKGDLPLTDVRRASARLRLPAELAGVVTVLKEPEDLPVAEVSKTEGKPVVLALEPGNYTAAAESRRHGPRGAPGPERRRGPGGPPPGVFGPRSIGWRARVRPVWSRAPWCRRRRGSCRLRWRPPSHRPMATSRAARLSHSDPRRGSPTPSATPSPAWATSCLKWARTPVHRTLRLRVRVLRMRVLRTRALRTQARPPCRLGKSNRSPSPPTPTRRPHRPAQPRPAPPHFSRPSAEHLVPVAPDVDSSATLHHGLDLRRSPAIAALASAALPGAGQFTNGQWAKGGATLGAWALATSGAFGIQRAMGNEMPGWGGMIFTGPTPMLMLAQGIRGWAAADAWEQRKREAHRPVTGLVLGYSTAWYHAPTVADEVFGHAAIASAGLTLDWVMQRGFSLGADRTGYLRRPDRSVIVNSGVRMGFGLFERRRVRPSLFLFGDLEVDTARQALVPARVLAGGGAEVRAYLTPRYFLSLEGRGGPCDGALRWNTAAGLGLHFGHPGQGRPVRTRMQPRDPDIQEG